MSRVKNNLSKKMGGLRYTITEKEIKLTGGAPASLPRITWGEETEETANEVLDRERDTQGRRNNKQINLARVFLPVALEKGPRLARDLFKEAEAEGISPDQLKRAKYELNVAFGNSIWPHRGRLIWPHLRHKCLFPPAC